MVHTANKQKVKNVIGSNWKQRKGEIHQWFNIQKDNVKDSNGSKQKDTQNDITGSSCKQNAK